MDPSMAGTGPIASRLSADGFVLFKECFPDVVGLAGFSGFGSVVTIPGLDDIQVLEPHRTDESTPNTYSGNFGVQAFPLHTDLAHWYLPPKYFALRCIVGSHQVFTRLVDSKDVFPSIGRQNLMRALVRPRRPINGNRPLLRVLGQQNGQDLFRWDSLFVVPATVGSRIICGELAHALSLAQPLDVLLDKPGDTLIIDNWRMIHGRSPVSSADHVRKIERAYFGAIH